MEYTLKSHKRFAADMEKAGYEVEPYHGRNYYEGPAVRVDRDEEHDVIRATKVRLRTDQMGKSGLVIYPQD